jgi:hypothetical protein
MNITQAMFSRLLVDAVKHSTVLKSYKYLSASYGMEVSAPGFGATLSDKGSPFFYSKEWVESGYGDAITAGFPALFLIEYNIEQKKPFGFANTQKAVVNFELSVIDEITSDCGEDQQTIHEVNKKTQDILAYVCEYIGQAVYVEKSEYGTGLFHRGVLSDTDLVTAIEWGQILSQQQQTASMIRVEFQSAKRYGTAILFSITMPVCNNLLKPNFTNSKCEVRPETDCCS